MAQTFRAMFRRWTGFSRRFAAAALSNPRNVTSLDARSKFQKVFDDNLFGGKESRSGEGSSLIQTRVIRTEIPKILRELNIGVLLDAPCGDWNWMRATNLGEARYIGADIVPALVANNDAQFGSDRVRFICANLAGDILPNADLILCRDCMVHLSFEDAFQVLRNFRRTGARYLLATTFTNRKENLDLGAGFWRPLNKQVFPFNFPAPLKLINEECTEGGGDFSDKCLGLWDLREIRLSQ
jgi:hypothetical protein